MACGQSYKKSDISFKFKKLRSFLLAVNNIELCKRMLSMYMYFGKFFFT